MRKPKKSTLRRKADELCSRLARSRGYCEAKLPGCQGNRNLQWCHGITRGWGSLRYEPKNWLCLCASCHRKIDINFLLKWEVWERVKGKEVVQWLKKQRPQPSILTIEWYQKIIKELEQKLYGESTND